MLLLASLACLAPTGRAAQAASDCGVVQGTVLDAADGSPLPLCSVQLLDVGRGASTDARGSFLLPHIPAGSHRLKASRVDRHDELREIRVAAGDTLRLVLRLTARALPLADVQVESQQRRVERLHQPALTLRAAELQQELGLTLAETLSEQTGIASRSMGPAPARPVLRGHSGDRLLLLEDGAGTGDLSATSADHAVAIEPLTSRRVDWIRGAETLLYSSGAAGGVLDVDHGLVPSELPAKPSGTLAVVGESVSRALGGTARLDAATRQVGWMLEGSLRKSGDQDTPEGRLRNSSLQTGSLSAGAGYVGDRLRAGVGATAYESDYGIPGGFVGGHPNGVDIELSRRNLHLDADWRPEGGLRHLKLGTTLSHYEHVEYESSGLVGISFDVLSAQSWLEAGLPSWGDLREGRLKLEAEWRNFATGGLSHAPDTDERHLALAWLEHALLPGGWHLHAAVRGDQKWITPDRERISLVVGHIRERQFQGLSAAFQVDAPEIPLAGWSLQAGSTLQRTWRPPTVEELFSGGPHLAAYSYEIGNPELDAERGWLADAGLEARRPGVSIRLRGYWQRFDGYVFPSFTGRMSARRADLYEYRTVGRDAEHLGLELDGDARTGGWKASWGFAMPRARLRHGGDLPAVPPTSGRLQIGREWGPWEAGVQLSGALAQDHVYQAEDPGALPEARTAGWARLDLHGGWRGTLGGRLNQVDVKLENALGQEYRNHLSRVRSVMPEAGRNFKLVWRMYF